MKTRLPSFNRKKINKENLKEVSTFLSFGPGANLMQTYTSGNDLIYAEGEPQTGVAKVFRIKNYTQDQLKYVDLEKSKDWALDGGAREWFSQNATHAWTGTSWEEINKPFLT